MKIPQKTVFLISAALFFLLSMSPMALCGADPAPSASEAEKLFSLEEQYMRALEKKDYETLYGLQHPLFKALISFKKFRENEGRVLLDMEKFNRLTRLPGVYTYNPFLRYEIVGFDVDAVYMDDSGKFSKIETFVSKDVSFSLPVKGPMIISNKVSHYWERVDSNWYVLSKYMDIPAIHISGDMTGYDARERKMLLPEEYAVYRKVFEREKRP